MRIDASALGAALAAIIAAPAPAGAQDAMAKFSSPQSFSSPHALSRKAASQMAVPVVTCTCRFQGRDFQLGEQVCLKTPDGTQMAQCATVLNNTSWKFTGMSCTISSLSSPRPILASLFGPQPPAGH